VSILIKNGRLEFSAIRDLDVPTIPDRYCPAICQPSKRPADSFQRYAYIGADIGTFHRQIYFLQAFPARVLVGFEHLQEETNPGCRTMPAEESGMASSLVKIVG